MPKAIEMDKAFDQAFSPGGGAPVKDYARAMGEGMLESVMGSLAEKAKQSLVGGETEGGRSESLDAVLAQMAKLKMVRELLGAGGAEGTDSGSATVMKALLDSQTKQTQFMVESQSKSEERMLALIKEMRAEQRAAQDRLEAKLEEKQRGGEDNEWTALAKQMFAQRLTTDPVQAYAEQRRQFFEEYERERGQDKVTNLEEFKAKKAFEIEERKLEAQERSDKAKAEYQNQIIGTIFSAVRPGQGAPAPAPAGDPAPNALFRVRCAHCAEVFALAQEQPPGTQLTCPRCQGLIRIPGEAPPPPDAPPPGSVGGFPFADEEEG